MSFLKRPLFCFLKKTRYFIHLTEQTRLIYPYIIPYLVIRRGCYLTYSFQHFLLLFSKGFPAKTNIRKDNTAKTLFSHKHNLVS